MRKTVVAFAILGILSACGWPSKRPSAAPCPLCSHHQPCADDSYMPDPALPSAPTYSDVEHDACEFEIVAILVAPKTMGLYITDPKGTYGYTVFTLPEMRQVLNQEEVMLLTVQSAGITYPMGYAEAENNELGLVVSTLCEREYKRTCKATITTNGPDYKSLTVKMSADPNMVFKWDAN
jgi:hypothetical protein